MSLPERPKGHGLLEGKHVLITAALWKISEDRTGGTYA